MQGAWCEYSICTPDIKYVTKYITQPIVTNIDPKKFTHVAQHASDDTSGYGKFGGNLCFIISSSN